jgi:hypothetical protein
VFPELFRYFVLCAPICVSHCVKDSGVQGSPVFPIVGIPWETGDRGEMNQILHDLGAFKF